MFAIIFALMCLCLVKEHNNEFQILMNSPTPINFTVPKKVIRKQMYEMPISRVN